MGEQDPFFRMLAGAEHHHDERQLDFRFLGRETMPTTGMVQIEGCAACGAKLCLPHKRCARCASVLYCGHGCQRAHWPTHRSACAIGRAFRPVGPARQQAVTALELERRVEASEPSAVGALPLPFTGLELRGLRCALEGDGYAVFDGVGVEGRWSNRVASEIEALHAAGKLTASLNKLTTKHGATPAESEGVILPVCAPGPSMHPCLLGEIAFMYMLNVLTQPPV
eukprot:SAG11_NODE_129_length_15500_cov_16.145250_18_plen_225_part_00